MKTEQIILGMAFVGFLLLVPTNAQAQVDDSWLEHYSGDIGWKWEKARLDNFAIQILNKPEMIGYIFIYSGESSWPGEAQNRAIQIRRYLINVRRVPWNRVMWQHGGRFRGDGLEIRTLTVPRSTLAGFGGYLYESPPEGHTIKPCSAAKENVRPGAANTRLERTRQRARLKSKKLCSVREG